MFGEVGTLPKEYHIVSDPAIPTVIDTSCIVPHELREELKQELSRMTELGVIEPVPEPTDWVSSLVITRKPNGSLKVCLDPRDLNKAIKRHHHPMPTTEEIFTQMTDAKFFTELDASNAFWQVKFDEESSKLLTFNTPFGRYKYLCMPYGIHSASEICQATISEISSGLQGAANSQDDIMVWGSSKEEIKQRTTAVLKAVRKGGLKLRSQNVSSI